MMTKHLNLTLTHITRKHRVRYLITEAKQEAVGEELIHRRKVGVVDLLDHIRRVKEFSK